MIYQLLRCWVLGLVLPLAAGAQIPTVSVKTITGKPVSTETFKNDGKPMILSFWATWCKPCIQELNSLKDEYQVLHAETGVKVIAVSIDDSRSSNRVQSFLASKGWPYEVYLDENSEFKRAMGVANVPHTFVLDGMGKVVAQHTSYVPGDELNVVNEVREAAKKR
jgi:peroxiredoxin